MNNYEINDWEFEPMDWNYPYWVNFEDIGVE